MVTTTKKKTPLQALFNTVFNHSSPMHRTQGLRTMDFLMCVANWRDHQVCPPARREVGRSSHPNLSFKKAPWKKRPPNWEWKVRNSSPAEGGYGSQRAGHPQAPGTPAQAGCQSHKGTWRHGPRTAALNPEWSQGSFTLWKINPFMPEVAIFFVKIQTLAMTLSCRI